MDKFRKVFVWNDKIGVDKTRKMRYHMKWINAVSAAEI